MTVNSSVWSDVERLIADFKINPPKFENGVQLERASDIPIIPIEWLWPGWLACGKLHILAGSPGTGKTTIAMSFASIVSTGGCFPCGAKCEQGSVLIWTGEDDPKDTLNPRLKALGADLKNIYFIISFIKGGESRSFDPSKDIDALKARALELGNVRLIIVDPIVSAVAGDGHKSNDVRRGLQPLVDLSQAINSALLGITHFTKGSAGSDPLDRVIGSQAFGALARVVMVAAKETTEEVGASSRHFITRAKSNIGTDGGGFDYELIEATLPDHPGVSTSRLDWKKQIYGSARELLNCVEVSNRDSFSPTERQDAKDFLVHFLAEGPQPVVAIKSDATGAGHTWRTVERAKKDLGIVAYKAGVKEGWFWRML